MNKIKRHWNRNMIVYIVLVPILIHFAIFQAYPFIYSFVLTFTDWQINGTSQFVGLQNWVHLFHDKLAWRSLFNTLLFSIYYIVPTMALGLAFSILVNTGLKMAGVFKAIFFLPYVTSLAILAAIWAWFFNGNEDGMVNTLLSILGIKTQLFLSSSVEALMVLAGLSIFQVSGQMMVYYFAGLRSIPSQLYEAASIDGASGWKMFWKITFPLLKPIHFYVAILTTVMSFKVFDQTFLLTSGGPNNSTTTIVYYLYRQGFESFDLSYASVLSYVLFIIVLLVSLIQRKFFGKDMIIY